MPKCPGGHGQRLVPVTKSLRDNTTPVLTKLSLGGSHRTRTALVVAAVGAIAALVAFVVWDKRGRDACRPGHAYANQVFSDGAIGYWRLNEATGRTARNSASAGPNGTYVGRRIFNSRGVVGDAPAATLGGGRTYVSIPAHAPYQRLTRWSVEAWVDPRSSAGKGADAAILTPAWRSTSLPFVLGYGSYNGAYTDARHVWTGFYSSTGFYRQVLESVDPHIGEITGTWSRVADPAVLPIGKWTHLVGTYDGSSIRLYRNGVLASSAVAKGKPPGAGNVSLYIGSRWWLRSWQFFDGSIADVALYAKALSREADRGALRRGARMLVLLAT